MNAYRPRIMWRAAVAIVPVTVIFAILAIMIVAVVVGGALMSISVAPWGRLQKSFDAIDAWVRGG